MYQNTQFRDNSPHFPLFPSWEGLGVGSDSRFPIPDSRFPIPDSRPKCKKPTPVRPHTSLLFYN
ncbi:MAG: hypothetical protein F6J98_39090, partial [Moorea sp. SIO4G2]|nr:hypothetical protein [Moorena sp. SIO4G2]